MLLSTLGDILVENMARSNDVTRAAKIANRAVENF